MQETAREKRQGKADVDECKAAEAMAALYRNKKTEVAESGKNAAASYYRRLARPRSKKYLTLMAQQIQISNRLNELNGLQQGVGITKSNGVIGEGNNVPEQGAAPDVAGQENVSDSVKQNGMPDSTKKENEERMKAETEKQVQARDAIAEEIARLKEELAWIQKEAEIEMPIGHGRLGFIYGSDKENRLLDMGVIGWQGKPYSNETEMLENVGAVTEQEKKQWIKADAIFLQSWSRCLVVEVYLTVICVVCEDGSVVSYRDEA